jgi:hypothetical protein
MATRVAYGYRPTGEGTDPIVEVMETAMRQADDVFTQVWPVDIMPWSACSYTHSFLS